MALTTAKISTAINIGKNPTTIAATGSSGSVMYTVPEGRIFVGRVGNFPLVNGVIVADGSITLTAGDAVVAGTGTTVRTLVGIESDAS